MRGKDHAKSGRILLREEIKKGRTEVKDRGKK
jgi:hypothetical protein